MVPARKVLTYPPTIRIKTLPCAQWHSKDRDESVKKPAVSTILQLDTPSGSRDFGGHGLRLSVRSIITWDLPHQFSLGVMRGLTRDSHADGHRLTSAIPGISTGNPEDDLPWL